MINEQTTNQDNTTLENEKIEELDKIKANITVNPETGEQMIVSNNVEEEDRSIEEVLEESFAKEIDDISTEKEVEFDELKNAINDSEENSKYNLTDESILEILKIVNRYRKDKSFNVYKAFPEEVQSIVNKSILEMGVPPMSPEGKRMRNAASIMLIDEYVRSVELNRITNDFNKEIENIYNTTGKEIADSVVGYTKERNKKYREIAEKIEDEDKKKKILEILDTIDETINLTDLKEFSKKCKIKPIELQKPSRVFNYIMQKYANSKYNIYDINMCIPVLLRNLNNGLDEPEYTRNDAIAFLLSFSRQCMNMDVNIAKDHSYMYYVLYNIILMDLNKGDNVEMSNTMKENIKEIIANLRARNKNVL